jgi:hypothetical protein
MVTKLPDPEEAVSEFEKAEVLRLDARNKAIAELYEEARENIIKAMQRGRNSAYFGYYNLDFDSEIVKDIRQKMMIELEKSGWYVKKSFRTREIDWYNGYGVKWSKLPFKPWWKFW